VVVVDSSGSVVVVGTVVVVVVDIVVVVEVEVVVVVVVDVVEVEVDVVEVELDVGVEVEVGVVVDVVVEVASGWVVVTELGRVVVVVEGRGVVPEVPGNPEPLAVGVPSARVVSDGLVVVTSPVLDEDSPGRVAVLAPTAAGWASEGSHPRTDSRFTSPSGTTTDAST